jgi:prepilin-type N-terminal cleavage/methylation domain-containing protein
MRKKQNLRISIKTFKRGFTLIELLIGMVIMLMVIVGALQLYMRSNKITVDQQQFAELQHDVRSSMFFISRDIRMAGAGLPIEFAVNFLEGQDNEDQGDAEVTPDRLKIMGKGNIEDPLNLKISQYQGSAATISVEDMSFEKYPYNSEAGPDNYYTQIGIVLILPNPASGCRGGEIREITQVHHSEGGTNEGFNFAIGLAEDINPPGGLAGTCPSSDDYDGGMITFINVKEYWLDVDGSYSGLTAGENGYIGGGEGGILYMTQNGYHYPLAQNVENLQFEYNGDLDDNGLLDGFTFWDPNWTGDPDIVGRIRQIRILILGRTPDRFVSVSGTPPDNLALYRRPALTTGDSAGQDDLHRRFLLESTSNIRNVSLSLYNTGER